VSRGGSQAEHLPYPYYYHYYSKSLSCKGRGSAVAVIPYYMWYGNLGIIYVSLILIFWWEHAEDKRLRKQAHTAHVCKQERKILAVFLIISVSRL
jgi:hypothetical protein